MWKTAAEMTIDEFAQELVRIRNKAYFIKTVVGTRQDRSYKNQKRGDFFRGNEVTGQQATWLREMRKKYGKSDKDE